MNLILTKDALYQLSYVGMERETGFEPATHSLEGCCSSQLSYSRKIGDLLKLRLADSESPFADDNFTKSQAFKNSGGEGRIRTSEGDSRQIYSLFPLAAREPLHGVPLELAMGLEPATG